jgi:hypothetical protein
MIWNPGIQEKESEDFPIEISSWLLGFQIPSSLIRNPSWFPGFKI